MPTYPLHDDAADFYSGVEDAALARDGKQGIQTYLEDVQDKASRLQHRINRINPRAKRREPLRPCLSKYGGSDCKHGFPETALLTDGPHFVCLGIERERNLQLEGSVACSSAAWVGTLAKTKMAFPGRLLRRVPLHEKRRVLRRVQLDSSVAISESTAAGKDAETALRGGYGAINRSARSRCQSSTDAHMCSKTSK